MNYLLNSAELILKIFITRNHDHRITIKKYTLISQPNWMWLAGATRHFPKDGARKRNSRTTPKI